MYVKKFIKFINGYLYFLCYFFLMFCITGLVLMFRTELNAWAQGGSHHSSLSMEMSQQEMSIFNYADEGAPISERKNIRLRIF